MYRVPASHRSCDKFLVMHLKVTKGVERGKVPHLFFVFWHSTPTLRTLPPGRQQDDNPPDADGWISHWEELLISSFFFRRFTPSSRSPETEASAGRPSCSVSDKRGILVGDKWRSRARVVRVRGEQPRRGPEGSEGMSKVMCEEDEERLDPAPRGSTTQMALRGNKRGSWCCGAGRGMGTTTPECKWHLQTTSPTLMKLYHPAQSIIIREESCPTGTIKRFVFWMPVGSSCLLIFHGAPGRKSTLRYR